MAGKLTSWNVLRADRAASPVDVGATVYRCRHYDYGSASDDTRRLNLEHVSVTLDPDGEYPFFTIPREDLSAALPSHEHGGEGR